jgi:hypothetical protein
VHYIPISSPAFLERFPRARGDGPPDLSARALGVLAAQIGASWSSMRARRLGRGDVCQA